MQFIAGMITGVVVHEVTEAIVKRNKKVKKFLKKVQRSVDTAWSRMRKTAYELPHGVFKMTGFAK